MTNAMVPAMTAPTMPTPAPIPLPAPLVEEDELAALLADVADPEEVAAPVPVGVAELAG